MDLATIAPPNHQAIVNFGKGDRDKAKSYLLMLAAWLGGFGENTSRTYRCAARQFFDLFEWVCPEDVTPAHVVAFRKWLLEHKQVAESTCYYRMSAVSSFFDFLMKPTSASSDPLIRSNPFHAVSRKDIQPTPYARPKVMEWDTFMQILESIPSDPTGLRDKAILLFYAFTGRRRAEVASLRIRDLDLRGDPRSYTVKVKGGQVQTYELPDICYDAMRAYWVAADRLHDLHADAGVFTPNTECHLTKHLDPDKPLSKRTMNEILYRSVVRAGLDVTDESLCIHAIRHMAARDLNASGARLQDIQAFLGHFSPATTQIYLGRLSGPRSAHTDALMKVRENAAQLARGLRGPSEDRSDPESP